MNRFIDKIAMDFKKKLFLQSYNNSEERNEQKKSRRKRQCNC